MNQDAQAVSEFLDLSEAVLVCPAGLSGSEDRAVTMLREEIEKRTGIRWTRTQRWPSSGVPVVAVGATDDLDDFAEPHVDAVSEEDETGTPEGYRVRVLASVPAVFVIGNDARGVLFGVGYLLRKLQMEMGRIVLPEDVDIATAPAYPLRGHQLGYRDKTNSYCAWNLDQWEQYIRNLVVFGANPVGRQARQRAFSKAAPGDDGRGVAAGG